MYTATEPVTAANHYGVGFGVAGHTKTAIYKLQLPDLQELF